MRKNIYKVLIFIVLICLLQSTVFILNSNAAMVIKPGTGIHTSLTANNAFQYCRDLALPTSSLGENQLDPHLAKSTDWGITAYLGLSQFGAITGTVGPNVTVHYGEDSTRTYTSTNGNETGVLNFGASYTQTAFVIQGATTGNHISKLLDTNNSRYVDTTDDYSSVAKTRGMAWAEIVSWGYAFQAPNASDYPVPVRTQTGGSAVNQGWGYQGNGWDHGDVTYRPAIWN